jgi:hypothetical protein
MKPCVHKLRTVLACCLAFAFSSAFLSAQPEGQRPVEDTLGLTNGLQEFETPEFKVKLVRSSQTIAALEPKGTSGFDFTPADQLAQRSGNRFYHLGDIRVRLRTGNSTEWKNYSTAESRRPVTVLATSGRTLAKADISPTLPDDCPLEITRSWLLDDGKLTLRFELKNRSSAPVEIGGLGIPLIFNNYITGRSLDQAHAICSFSDPAIALDAGYVQVTRLSGEGPALVVVPDGKSPLEAYNPLLTDRTPRSQPFEAFYEWLVRSHAWSVQEWKGVSQWNEPTSETLEPGATRTVGLKFLLSPEIRTIEKTLAENKRPVAVGVPGYILPMDLNAQLFLKYGSRVKTISAFPEGAIEIKSNGKRGDWQSYELRGKKWGRARLTIDYRDGTRQTISYYVIKPAAEAVADLGDFLFTRHWYVDPDDPFKRSPSIMNYDRAKNRIVTQDARAWIAGLQDEGGAGSWVAGAMKLFIQPKAEEVAKFEQFVDGVLWGGIQYNDGPRKFGVRKSLFYYDTNSFPNYYDPNIRYGGWTSWNRREAESIGRAYNYPHVAAAYWSMYRIARNTDGIVQKHSWDWYLNQAYETARALIRTNPNGRHAVGYVDVGLMEGTIFVRVLEDLKREGWHDKAAEIEAGMKRRADIWKAKAYPFGSEMAWDSTGQEEVYAWMKYFGLDDKALVALNSILGYMPTVPHWGYNGNARRYWDFYYGAAPGRTGRQERQIHHYGSGLNAIPVLHAYREQPDDFHLLRVGYGGTMGALSNIDEEGFAGTAFHAWPDIMAWDTYAGDYGPNFFGHSMNAATYVVKHPELGWLSFGGNLNEKRNTVTVQPRDALRQRLYIAPLGLWITLDSGRIESAELNLKNNTVRITLEPATKQVSSALLRIEQPAKPMNVASYRLARTFITEREAFKIPLQSGPTTIELIPAKQ